MGLGLDGKVLPSMHETLASIPCIAFKMKIVQQRAPTLLILHEGSNQPSHARPGLAASRIGKRWVSVVYVAAAFSSLDTAEVARLEPGQPGPGQWHSLLNSLRQIIGILQKRQTASDAGASGS